MSRPVPTGGAATRGPAAGLTWRTLAVTGLAAAALATAMTTASQAEPVQAMASGPVAAAAAAPALKCTAATERDKPVTFSPPVGLVQRKVAARGTVALSDCTSPDGRHRKIHHGRLTMSGTANATCTRARDVRGKGTITWYDAQNRELGTTGVRPAQREVVGYNPGDSLLAGTAVSGPLAGSRIQGTATPTSDTSRCAGAGLDSVHGTGKVSLS
ncbi:hypothetical protein [Actinomadura rubrisoli]|uniref:Secreted protein n=1 Tax=Actinomadura rubrisoli TaxID=2530368 RepID=A0A4R5BSZ0_9ACTN|nr:hypothetical protein [Actinomadura rubrisoli]TDD89139.1 hypothetical protein E1298_14445 [Actinomadura rubrisoli]